MYQISDSFIQEYKDLIAEILQRAGFAVEQKQDGRTIIELLDPADARIIQGLVDYDII